MKLTSSALLVAALVLPVAARADTKGYVIRSDETIHGVIDSINGKYGVTVRDGRVLSSVTLHRGTIINPVGLRLEPGMQVTIAGHADGKTFDANTIDAPMEYLEDQEQVRRAEANTSPFTPLINTNGAYQGNGPTAGGGG